MHPTQQKKFESYCRELGLSQPSLQGDGYFVETFRDKERVIDPGRYEGGKRAFTTSIYYALAGEGITAFNQLKSTQYWQYCDGCPQKVYVLDEKTGRLQTTILGNPLLHREVIGKIPICYQLVILPHQWVAAELVDKQSFSLITCVTCPGFDDRDFKLGDEEWLLERFAEQAKLIRQFTSKNK